MLIQVKQLALVGSVVALSVNAQPAQDRARTESEKAKPPVAEKKEYQGRKRARTNRNPTDTRIKDEGVKLPPCTVESRESIECAK